MNRIANEEGMHPRVLLEVNVAGEGSKFGFKPETLRAEMESLLALPRLSIEGLMMYSAARGRSGSLAELFSCSCANCATRSKKNST